VFYVCKFAFKEEEEDGCSVSLDLGCELANSSRLVFVLHEASNEGDSNCAWDFERMRNRAYTKEGSSTREGHFFRFGAKEEVKFLVICCSFYFCGSCVHYCFR
jgi:hypothetical protein